jgi:putative hemolysin
VSRPLYLLSRAARPLIWFLTASSNLLLRPFHDRTTFREARLSREELQQLVEEAATAGTVDKETGDIASRAIDLGWLRAYSVMIPRSAVTWLRLDASPETVERVLRDSPHARYPVLDATENPAGYVVTHEVYAQLLAGSLDMQGLRRDLPTFPEQAPAVEVLRALQQARTEIGLVIDESGLPTGLVSIEVLAEELFGEIAAERESVVQSIAPVGETAFDIRGDTPVHVVNRELGLVLPVEATATTIGGVILAAHGSFPPRGARVTLPGGIDAEVLECSARRVLLVRIHRGKQPSDVGSEDSSR